jgi:histidyl-tRNA synthetase
MSATSDNPALITPRTLKGFRDFLPAAMIPREHLIETARRVYRSFGFCPIDTPALEYLDILTGKGSDETDKQLYRFQDHGGRHVGMRFDLTVPLARFAAQYIGKLGVPFKRYHIATVWRGENTQRGRYREFMQCDFDTIGTTAIASDIETVLVIHELMLALNITDFTIRVNNRRVLNGLLSHLGLGEVSTEVLRALDKLPKIGAEKVAAEMAHTAHTSAQQAERVLQLASLHGDNQSILSQLESLFSSNELGARGVRELRDVILGARAAGVPEERLQLDASIARGLDYYTGTIVETFLDDLPRIGSVCSGGRYDNLAQLYTRQQLPGIGASLGLDRLLAALEDLGLVDGSTATADLFIPFFDPDRLHDYLRLAQQLRRAGLTVEVYPEPKKIAQQLKYADQRGFRVAVIAGDREFQQEIVQVKDLRARSSEEADVSQGIEPLVHRIRELLAEGR